MPVTTDALQAAGGRRRARRVAGCVGLGPPQWGPQAEANGKKGALVAAGAALGLGAANGIVAFFSTLGTQVY